MGCAPAGCAVGEGWHGQVLSVVTVLLQGPGSVPSLTFSSY